MGPPRKQVSFERMQAILASHAPSDSKPLEAAQSPKEKPAQPESSLRWRQIAPHTWESDKGPVILEAEGKFIVYDRVSKNGHTAQVIGSFPDGKTAKDFVRLLP